MSDDACYADEIADYRWEGFPLAEKIGWMQGAPGSSAIQPGVDALRGLSARYAESQQTVQAGLAKLGVGWQGRSADAASHAISKLADWVATPGRTASGGSTSLGTYGASFNAMRPHIAPAPGAVGPLAGPTGSADGVGVLARFQSPFSLRMEQVVAADARANAALRAHQQTTQAALDSFGSTPASPQVSAGAVPGASADARTARATPVPGGGGVATPSAGGTGNGSAVGSPGPGAAGGGGAAKSGAGNHGAPAGAGTGGTASAGAGAAAPPAPAPPDAGWTPLAPAPNGGAYGGGLVTGPNGGLVPGPLSPSFPASPDLSGPGRASGFGAPSGSGAGYRPPPLEPRTGAVPPRSGAGFGGDFGVPRNAPGRALGATGAAPLGMGGVGRGGDERTHRNQTFIPSDEPFRVDFFDVAPPVLGVRSEEAW